MICRFGILLNINAQPGIDGDGSERCFREFLRSTSRSNVLTQKNFLNWEKIQIFLEKLICFLGKTVSRVFLLPVFRTFSFSQRYSIGNFKTRVSELSRTTRTGNFSLRETPYFPLTKLLLLDIKNIQVLYLACLFL